MRIRFCSRFCLPAALVVAAATTVAAAAPAPPAAPANKLVIDPTGTLAPDGTITLTGTYRCTAQRPAGAVVVATNLVQHGATSGIGGSAATCDGRLHAWRNSARLSRIPYRPGAAEADGTLLQFRRDKMGIPLPHFLAVAPLRPLTLVARP
ncbi:MULTISPECIES: DUF6299 family protein [Streptomyces]|uniref:DUF6299 domain-containing protein n=1 Tax=Streptomyces luteosporeus TaxID=173856 RepID=A0ABN3TQL7_9ACTN